MLAVALFSITFVLTLIQMRRARDGGCTMAVSKPPNGCAGIVGQGRCATSLLTVLAFIVIFPLYITVVNSLLTPSQISARPPTFFPTEPAVGQLQRRVGRRAHVALPREQRDRHR